MVGDKQLVAMLALGSRVLLFLSQVLLDYFIADYDSSVILRAKGVQGNSTSAQVLIDYWIPLSGFGKWDAVYFCYIAHYGYQYEQMLAFFPLFPWMIGGMSKVLQSSLGASIDRELILITTGFLVNSCFFVLSNVALYQLSIQSGFAREVALISTVLYSINPASIFMSALYSETTFCMLIFTGLLLLSSKEQSVWNFAFAACFFALSSCTRSNGLVAIGFLACRLLKEIYAEMYGKNYVKQELFLLKAIVVIIKLVIILLSAMPFLFLQYKHFIAFCSEQQNPKPQWCSSPIPLSYSYVQKKYWNVGFLNYYEVKQIPNFLLALPVVLLSLSTIKSYFKDKRHFQRLMTLDLLSDDMTSSWAEKKGKTKGCDFMTNPHLTPYLMHLLFLTIVGITTIHVQVLTRLLFSSTPILYWYSSTIITRDISTEDNIYSNFCTKLILFYYISYFFVGVLMHCNFYPWT